MLLASLAFAVGCAPAPAPLPVPAAGTIASAGSGGTAGATAGILTSAGTAGPSVVVGGTGGGATAGAGGAAGAAGMAWAGMGANAGMGGAAGVFGSAGMAGAAGMAGTVGTAGMGGAAGIGSAGTVGNAGVGGTPVIDWPADGFPHKSVHLQIYRFEFLDVPLAWTQARIEQDLQTVKQYYEAQSYGRFTVTWDVSQPVFKLDKTRGTFTGKWHDWVKEYEAKLQPLGVDPRNPPPGTIVMIAAPEIHQIVNGKQTSLSVLWYVE